MLHKCTFVNSSVYTQICSSFFMFRDVRGDGSATLMASPVLEALCLAIYNVNFQYNIILEH